jgi:hypothetical protein
MPAYRAEHLKRTRLGTLQGGRQVTDNPAGPVGQGQLDRPVQILDDIAEPAGNLKDHYLTYDVCSDPHLWACGRTVGSPPLKLGREGTYVVVEICGKTVRIAQSLHHGTLDSLVLE